VYASFPPSQREYTVAVETLRRRAASLTVSSKSAPTVTFSCITGALNDRRKSPKPGEGTESASSETSPDCEDLRDPASFDSQCGQDWGASGRWFKSSRHDSRKAPELQSNLRLRGLRFSAGLPPGLPFRGAPSCGPVAPIPAGNPAPATRSSSSGRLVSAIPVRAPTGPA
jgi:hypothetical protein